MKENYQYRCSGVCSKGINIEIEEDKVCSVQFLGGCMGNTQGVAALAKDMTMDEVINRLEGINCAGKGTSCPDQLAKALRLIKAQRAQRKAQETA